MEKFYKNELIQNCIYPQNPWEIIETSFNIKNNYRSETIFALGNGYFGTRGTFEEAYDFDIDTGLEGNFINGFYKSEKTRYGELVFGYPEKSRTILNVPNAKKIKLYVCGEEFDMRKGIFISYERKLDLKNGLLTRTMIWESPQKRRIHIKIKRYTSFTRPNLMVIEYFVTPIDFNGEIRFVSEIDTNVVNHTKNTNPLIDYGPCGRTLINEKVHADNNRAAVIQRVKNNGFHLYCGTVLSLKKISPKKSLKDFDPVFTSTIKDGCPITETSIVMNECESAALGKISGYWTSLEPQPGAAELNKSFLFNIPLESLEKKAESELRSALNAGFQELENEQRAYMESFWDNADVIMNGNVSVQQGIRFNLFHILQGAPRNRDEYASVVDNNFFTNSMAGTWMSITQGFAGMRVRDDTLFFKPRLPHGWKSCSFKIIFRGRRICVKISHGGAVFKLIEGDPLTIHVDGKPVFIKMELT